MRQWSCMSAVKWLINTFLPFFLSFFLFFFSFSSFFLSLPFFLPPFPLPVPPSSTFVPSCYLNPWLASECIECRWGAVIRRTLINDWCGKNLRRYVLLKEMCRRGWKEKERKKKRVRERNRSGTKYGKSGETLGKHFLILTLTSVLIYNFLIINQRKLFSI